MSMCRVQFNRRKRLYRILIRYRIGNVIPGTPPCRLWWVVLLFYWRNFRLQSYTSCWYRVDTPTFTRITMAKSISWLIPFREMRKLLLICVWAILFAVVRSMWIFYPEAFIRKSVDLSGNPGIRGQECASGLYCLVVVPLFCIWVTSPHGAYCLRRCRSDGHITLVDVFYPGSFSCGGIPWFGKGCCKFFVLLVTCT